MASFFRGSCAIYWLVWLMVLAFAMGMTFYETSYVIVDNLAYKEVSSIVKGLCYFLAAYSFVGCIFVKCDISHLICFLCYTIPLIIIVPGLSIYGLLTSYSISRNNGSAFLGSGKLFGMVKAHWDQNGGKVPWWLIRTQMDLDCCGIYSFKDWQLLIHTTPQTPEIPIQCCRAYHGDKKAGKKTGDKVQQPQHQHQPHCLSRNVTKDVGGPLTEKRSKLGKPPDFFDYPWEKEVYLDDKSTYATYAISPPKPDDYPLIAANYTGIVNLKGCGNLIIRQHLDALDAFEAFFVILIISSILMFAVYVKSWCDGRHFSDGGSHHSLDVERISLIELEEEEQETVRIRASAAINVEELQILNKYTAVGEGGVIGKDEVRVIMAPTPMSNQTPVSTPKNTGNTGKLTVAGPVKDK